MNSTNQALSLIQTSTQSNLSEEELFQILYLADKIHIQHYSRLISNYNVHENRIYEMSVYKTYDYLSETDKEAIY